MTPTEPEKVSGAQWQSREAAPSPGVRDVGFSTTKRGDKTRPPPLTGAERQRIYRKKHQRGSTDLSREVLRLLAEVRRITGLPNDKALIKVLGRFVSKKNAEAERRGGSDPAQGGLDL